jgi:hypothetical protein
MRSVMMVIWVQLSLFLAVSLSGCADFKLVGDPLEEVHRDGGRFLRDRDSSDADISSPMRVLDATTLPLDAAASFSDVPEEFSLDVVDASVVSDRSSVSMAPPSLVLSPTTCHGRTLHLPEMFFQAGMTVWHFCYVTPDPRDREDGGPAPMRPASVSFGAGDDHEPLSLIPLVAATAPLVANPWTASVAVALPATFVTPRFNIRQDPPPGLSTVFWALDGDGSGGVRERGFLRVWRVTADGQQTEVPLAELFSVCEGHRLVSDMPSANYVPLGTCPHTLMSCVPGPFHCRSD